MVAPPTRAVASFGKTTFVSTALKDSDASASDS